VRSYLEPRGNPYTHAAGNHDHDFSGSGSGSVSINGDTSGGFDQDQPAFLVVGFIINY
jgi:hypothetical protein